MRFSIKTTREEILEENVVFHKNGADANSTLSRTILSKGQTVTAVYEYVVSISTLRTLGFMPDEAVEVKNGINALYVMHGEKCLKSKFLTRELAKMLPDLLIEQVMTEKASKYYSYVNGNKEYVSDKHDMYKQELNQTL